MRAQKRLLISLAALAAATLVGCLNSPEPASSSSFPVTESEIQAALAGDSLHPAPPPRPVVCDTLKARLAALDTASAEYKGLSNAVARVCAVHPDSGRVRPPKPDSLRPDSLRPRPDSLKPAAPRPPKPDSLRPVPPARDSLAVKPDSGRGPVPPKGPRPPKK